MPDYAVSQTVASAQFDRFLQPARMGSILEEMSNLFLRNTAFVRQDGGYTTAGVRMLTAWTLTGVNMSDAGRNVTDGGRLWIRITANAANWDIHVYKATGAASEVATATNVAAGAVATLAAANSSGLTGSVTLAATIAALAADTYSLQVFLGYPEMVRQIFNGVHQEDGACATALLAEIARMGADLDGMSLRAAGLARTVNMMKQLGRIWVIPAERIQFLTKQATPDAGTITVTVDGAFERFRQNWKDNATIQKVPVTTIAAAAAAYAATNLGTSAATLGTPGPNLEPGTIQGVCTKSGPGDETEFEITFTPTDGTGPIVGRNKLTVGKSWDDADIPVQISLAFGYTKTNDADHTDVAAATSITGITGLTADNSDDGKLYGYVAASGASWIYKFYSASARTAATLVAQSPAIATAAAFTATSMNGSGVQVGWVAGSGPIDADVFEIDQDPHKAGTSTTPPDQFTIAITRSALGWVQDLARRYYGWKFHAAAAPTFADTFGQRGALVMDGSL